MTIWPLPRSTFWKAVNPELCSLACNWLVTEDRSRLILPPAGLDRADADASEATLTDDELTDTWECGDVVPGGVSHERHVRIAWTLLSRHPHVEAVERIVSGTRRACAA